MKAKDLFFKFFIVSKSACLLYGSWILINASIDIFTDGTPEPYITNFFGKVLSDTQLGHGTALFFLLAGIAGLIFTIGFLLVGLTHVDTDKANV